MRAIQTFSVLILVMFVFTSMSYSGGAESKRVQRDVLRMKRAMNTGNINTFVSYLWPGAIQKMGGRKAAYEMLHLVHQSFVVHQGGQFANIRFPKPPRFFRSNGMQYVLVPYSQIINLKKTGSSKKSTTFFVGARKSKMQKWRYMDGVRLNRRKIGIYFPNFPSDVELPRNHTQ